MQKNIIDLIEKKWQTKTLRQEVWGYQFQPRTKWLKEKYSIREINSYEKENSILLPSDLVDFLQITKGIDMPQVHVNLNNQLKQNWILNLADKNLHFIKPIKHAIEELQLDDNDFLLPIYGNRFVVCNKLKRYETSKIVSINEADCIVYAHSLEVFLLKDFV